jgi:hypothetical protein
VHLDVTGGVFVLNMGFGADILQKTPRAPPGDGGTGGGRGAQSWDARRPCFGGQPFAGGSTGNVAKLGAQCGALKLPIGVGGTSIRATEPSSSGPPLMC